MSTINEISLVQKLRRTYIIALTLIALTLIGSQIFIQNHLFFQRGLSETINKAGRQRMLSQKITKDLLLIGDEQLDQDERIAFLDILSQDIRLWETSHESLKYSTQVETSIYADDIKKLFFQMDSYYVPLLDVASVRLAEDPRDAIINREKALLNERQYLIKMDEIVQLLERGGEYKVQQLRRIELLLFIIGLGILLLEYFFLFKPGDRAMQGYISDIKTNNDNLAGTLNELQVVKDEKVKLNHELSALNDALTNTIAYTTVRMDHSPIYVSKVLLDWFTKDQYTKSNGIETLLSPHEPQQAQIRSFLETAKSKRKKTTIDLNDAQGNMRTYDIEAIPMNSLAGQQHQLIIINDITEKRLIQTEIDQIQEAKFEAKIQEQKARSLLIIEAQETERKRIARDLHDGVGQSLTALKFQVQAMGNQHNDTLNDGLTQLNQDIRSLIQEVRMVTFNLVPPELTDYGLVTALKKLVDKVDAETETKVSLHIEEHIEDRLEPYAETNLYRVTQEGLNNALKYSEASEIKIIYRRNSELLSITVDDNGQGFDPDQIDPSKNGSGMGLEFMRERMNYLDGKLYIDSTPNKGTIITLNMRS